MYNSYSYNNKKIGLIIFSFILCLFIGLYKFFALPHVHHWFDSRKSVETKTLQKEKQTTKQKPAKKEITTKDTKTESEQQGQQRSFKSNDTIYTYNTTSGTKNYNVEKQAVPDAKAEKQRKKLEREYEREQRRLEKKAEKKKAKLKQYTQQEYLNEEGE